MIRRVTVALLILGLAAGCRDSSGPTQGELTLRLTTPFSTDRALLIEVSGPGEIRSVQPAQPSLRVFSTNPASSVRAIVVGNLVSGPLLRFEVPDTRQSYSARILEVADVANVLRADLTRYAAEIK